MQLRIEMPFTVTPEQLKTFLTDRNLKLPVFLDSGGHIILDLNPRSRQSALELIDWLVTR
jgi:hypothetical protein